MSTAVSVPHGAACSCRLCSWKREKAYGASTSGVGLEPALVASVAPIEPEPAVYRVRWSIGRRYDSARNAGKGDYVPVFDPELLKVKQVLKEDGTPLMREPVVGYADGRTLYGPPEPVLAAEADELSEDDLTKQLRARAALEKRLKADGFVLSHDDAEGYTVYVQRKIVKPKAEAKRCPHCGQRMKS